MAIFISSDPLADIVGLALLTELLKIVIRHSELVNIIMVMLTNSKNPFSTPSLTASLPQVQNALLLLWIIRLHSYSSLLPLAEPIGLI